MQILGFVKAEANSQDTHTMVELARAYQSSKFSEDGKPLEGAYTDGFALSLQEGDSIDLNLGGKKLRLVGPTKAADGTVLTKGDKLYIGNLDKTKSSGKPFRWLKVRVLKADLEAAESVAEAAQA